MKNQFILLLLLINLAGCNVFRPLSRKSDNLSAGAGNQSSVKKSQPVFIQDISTESSGSPTGSSASPPGSSNSSTGSSKSFTGSSGSPTGSSGPTGSSASSAGSSQYAVKTAESPLYRNSDPKTAIPTGVYDDYDPLQFKYAILTNSPVEELTNLHLLIFMDHWYGVPYHYGGSNKDGIDCSAFVSLLLSSVYNINQLPRMSIDQYRATRRVSKKNLREGDLVFFHTMGKSKRVTHVGVYLYNNRFVHASIAGVQISDLGEGYYLHHYVGAGRVIDSDKSY